MRLYILAPLLLCAAIGGLYNPRVALLSWIGFGLSRPDILAFAPNAFNASFVFAAIALLRGIPYFGRISVWFRNPICLGLILLLAIQYLSALDAVVVNLSFPQINDYARLILIVMLIPLMMSSAQHLKWLLTTVAVSVGVIGVKYGLYGIIHGGVRFDGGYGTGLMSDNNFMAAAMVMAIPLCWYVRELWTGAFARIGLLFLIFTMIATVVMTYSRGGALALGLVLAMMIFRSKQRVRLTVILLIVTVPAVFLVKDTYFDRLSTLKAPTDESSALSRIANARAALLMWKDYPWLGVGFGTKNQARLWDQYVDKDVVNQELVVHNTYLQMLVDSGSIAFAVYMTLWLGTLFWLGRSISWTRRNRPELVVFPIAIQTSLAGSAVAALFLSQLHVEYPYILLMAAAVWAQVSKTYPTEAEDSESEPDQVLADLEGEHVAL